MKKIGYIILTVVLFVFFNKPLSAAVYNMKPGDKIIETYTYSIFDPLFRPSSFDYYLFTHIDNKPSTIYYKTLYFDLESDISRTFWTVSIRYLVEVLPSAVPGVHNFSATYTLSRNSHPVPYDPFVETKKIDFMVFIDGPDDPACLSQKLKTAGVLCTALMNCCVKDIKDTKDNYPVNDFIDTAIQKFETSWGNVQDKAKNKGMDCDDGSDEETGEMIIDAFEEIYDYIYSVIGEGNKDSISLCSDLLKMTGKKCSSLLNAYSVYVKDQSLNGDTKLTTAISRANAAFTNSFNKAKAKAVQKGLPCDDSIKTDLEYAIDALESDILSGMGIEMP